MRKICLIAASLFFVLISGNLSLEAARPIEAVKGKEYTITKKHGPWMIMVASFSNTRDEANRAEGISEHEAALELVYELRKKGIPAYIFEQEGELGRIETENRLRKREQRVYAAKRPMISVLAGNYPSTEESTAQRTLEYIKKKFKADFLIESGARFKPTPAKPTPLSGAFFTINPLLSPEEVKQSTVDPLLVNLNTQHDYSLFENSGEYTLVIATFTSNSSKFVLGDEEQKKESLFEFSGSLDKAAEDAWSLAEAMRNGAKLGYGENYEAFVWHDRYKSMVTIGSFSSRQDPKIAMFLRQYGAKQKPLPQNPTRTQLVAEYFTLPKVADATQAEKMWIFDPEPRLMKVPRYRR